MTGARVAIALVALSGLAAAPGHAGADPDFSAFQRLLNDYLSVTSAKGKPLETRFDYIRFYRDSTRAQRFLECRRQLLAVPPSQMDRKTRLAWALNTYNYLVIETITNHLWRRVERRGIERFLSPAAITTREGTFFKRIAITIEEKPYGLDDFERHFLCADHPQRSSDPPPDSLDPRVHFAAVCGAVGCPALQPRLFRSDGLDEQLDAAVRDALARPEHLRWDDKTRTLEASSIFDWYVGDFGGPDKAMEFIRRYAPPRIRSNIQRHKVTQIARFARWNWDLNQTL
jgi:hypothetical protein